MIQRSVSLKNIVDENAVKLEIATVNCVQSCRSTFSKPIQRMRSAPCCLFLLC